MRHYSKEELDLYRHGEMSVLGRIGCSSHLKECSACAALMEELQKEDALVAELQESIRLFGEVAEAPKRPAQEKQDIGHRLP